MSYDFQKQYSTFSVILNFWLYFDKNSCIIMSRKFRYNCNPYPTTRDLKIKMIIFKKVLTAENDCVNIPLL